MGEFDGWNTPDVLPLNNCYNYATNNRNEPPKDGGKPPQPADPGRKGHEKHPDVTAIGEKPGEVEYVDTSDGKRRLLKITCDRLKETVASDGLGEPKDGKCADTCWKVYLYVQEPGAAMTGDFHFVREGPGSGFSHKPNSGGTPVTRNQWNASSKAYDGPPIADPTKDPVGPGYKYCGVVCCCPDTKVAMAIPPARRPVMVAYGPHYGQGPTLFPATRPGALVELLAELPRLTDAQWQRGWGTAVTRCRVDVRDAERSRSVFLGEGAITLWDGVTRHLPDCGHVARTRVEALLGLPA